VSDLLSTGQVQQAGIAALYYLGVLAVVRLAGKRLAGQTTTFDLVILISLIAALQKATLKEGPGDVAVFVVTVLVLHRGLALVCARWPAVKRLVRGSPRALVVDGQVSRDAMAEEGVSYDELLAGLRKLGYASPDDVKLAMLEETGHISAVRRD
jgi:uncharacterized membrane protein YcaP (DUF421 family)